MLGCLLNFLGIKTQGIIITAKEMKEELWLWFSSWKTDGLEKPWGDFCSGLEGKTICSDGNVGSSLLLLCTCYSFFGSVLFKGVGECAGRRSGIRCQTALVKFNQVRFLLFPHFQTTGFLLGFACTAAPYEYPPLIATILRTCEPILSSQESYWKFIPHQESTQTQCFYFWRIFTTWRMLFQKMEKNTKNLWFLGVFCILNNHLSLELWAMFGDGMWIQPSENPDQESAFAKKAVLMYLEEYLPAKKYMKHGPVFQDFEWLEFFLINSLCLLCFATFVQCANFWGNDFHRASCILWLSLEWLCPCAVCMIDIWIDV